MKETNDKLDLIYKLIVNHIEILGDNHVLKADKEISYLLFQEDIEALIREYKRGDLRQREYIRQILVEVKHDMSSYLVNKNRYDQVIYELYLMLEDFLNNIEN